MQKNESNDVNSKILLFCSRMVTNPLDLCHTNLMAQGWCRNLFAQLIETKCNEYRPENPGQARSHRSHRNRLSRRVFRGIRGGSVSSARWNEVVMYSPCRCRRRSRGLRACRDLLNHPQAPRRWSEVIAL